MAFSEKIPVFDIDRLRMGLDGDGVRTLIGIAGCQLRCRYCLNPHSWNGDSEATMYTPEKLYEVVKQDNLYFLATGGGLTFGGGEPLLYTEAIAQLADLCPEEWSIWAETSLYVPTEQVAFAAGFVDCFLVDIKTTNPQIYRTYTGGNLELPLENLRQLLCFVGPEAITVRLPKIPVFTADEDLHKSEKMLRAMGVQNIDHLVYDRSAPLENKWCGCD